MNNRNKQNQKVRNVRAFVSAYLGSKSGQAALNRRPIRKRGEDGNFVQVWRNPAIAHAFKEAL